MSVEAIGILGTLALAIITALIGGIWRLWTEWKREREKAIAAARAEGVAQARNEALIREARSTIAQKDREGDTKDRLIATQQRRIDWYELEECPRLKRRIQELSDVITNLSARRS